MRSATVDLSSSVLIPNEAGAEFTTSPPSVSPAANGFSVRNTSPFYNASGHTYIYLAIRRPEQAAY